MKAATLVITSAAGDGSSLTSHPGAGLLNLVLRATREVEWSPQSVSFSIRPGEKFQSADLLALLTYSYTTGNYASREVETVAATDPLFAALVGPIRPDWKTIRRFRRVHRENLRRCILQVMHEALRICFGEGSTETVADHCVAVALTQWFEPLCVPFPDVEAAERIARAVYIDDVAA